MKWIFGLLLSFNAYAEDWFCLTDSGKRNDNVISSCGVGEAPSESLARTDALNQAIAEFATICKWSSDCAGKQKSVEPKRLTCKQTKDRWKCYRLIEVTIGEKAIRED